MESQIETASPQLSVPSAPPATAELILLPLSRLAPSADNPRRSFDPAALEELAESIAGHGLLENLVVRERPPLMLKNADERVLRMATHEIIAGERRWRACWWLVEQGRMDPDHPLPCLVKETDEAGARAMALIENLQRAELPPLEEGEAFAALIKLDGGTWTTAAIAGRIGKTQRYVQQRVALATKLAPVARQALEAGRISIEDARELSSAAPAHQAELIGTLGRNDYNAHLLRKGDRLREKIEDEWVPLANAIFPRELYTGPVHEEDLPPIYGDPAELGYEPGEKVDPEALLERAAVQGPFATDRKAFLKLQKKAVKAQLAELAKEWAWAELARYFDKWRYQGKRSKDKAKAGVVAVIEDDGRVIFHEGLVKKPENERRGGGLDYAEETRRMEEAARQRAAREKQIEAWLPGLRKAVAALPSLAIRIALVDLIDDARHNDRVRKALAAAGFPLGRDYSEASVLRGLIKSVADEDLGELLAAIGQAIIKPSAWEEHDEFAIEIAKAAGVDLPECWQPASAKASEGEPQKEKAEASPAKAKKKSSAKAGKGGAKASAKKVAGKAAKKSAAKPASKRVPSAKASAARKAA